MSRRYPAGQDGVVRQLLASVGAGAAAEPPDAEVVEFDWSATCRFPPAALARVEALGPKLASALAEGLVSQLRADQEVQAEPLAQHYAGRLAEQLAGPEAFWVSLSSTDRTPAGWLIVAPELALHWIEQMLGGQAPAPEAKTKLTTVERGLLLDVLAALAGAVSATLQAEGPAGLARPEQVSTEAVEVADDPAREYCEWSFQVGGEDAAGRLRLLIASDLLAPAAEPGRSAPAGGGRARQAMIDHIGQVPIRVTARLGEARLPVREVFSLEAGDVLVTSKSVDEPADLLVEGKRILQGFAARSAGNYAVVIAAEAGGSEPPPAAQAAPPERNDGNG